MFRKTIAAAFMLMMFISSAAAEELFGIPVYPGAKYDEARTKLLKRAMSVKGSAYRTGDDIAKVIEFYRKQKLQLLKVGGPSKDRARFRKIETGVDVVVENVQRDSKGDAGKTDTFILIFKETEKGSKPDVAI